MSPIFSAVGSGSIFYTDPIHFGKNFFPSPQKVLEFGPKYLTFKTMYIVPNYRISGDMAN